MPTAINVDRVNPATKFCVQFFATHPDYVGGNHPLSKWYLHPRIFPQVRANSAYSPGSAPGESASWMIQQIDAYGYKPGGIGAPLLFQNVGVTPTKLMRHPDDAAVGVNRHSGQPIDGPTHTLYSTHGREATRAWMTSFATAFAGMMGSRPAPISIDNDYEDWPSPWFFVRKTVAAGSQAVGNFSAQLDDLRAGENMAEGYTGGGVDDGPSGGGGGGGEDSPSGDTPEEIIPGVNLATLWALAQANGASYNEASEWSPNPVTRPYFKSWSVDATSYAAKYAIYDPLLAYWPMMRTSNYQHVCGTPGQPYVYANGNDGDKKITPTIAETDSALECYDIVTGPYILPGETRQQCWRRIQRANIDAQVALSKTFVLWFTSPGFVHYGDATVYSPTADDLIWLLLYAYDTGKCRTAMYWSDFNGHDHDAAYDAVLAVFGTLDARGTPQQPDEPDEPTDTPAIPSSPLGSSVSNPTRILRIRIQEFLMRLAHADVFYEVRYDPVTGVPFDIDPGVDKPVQPTSVEANETASTFAVDRLMGSARVLYREKWMFTLKLRFKAEVILELFESKLSQNMLILPAIKGSPSVTLELHTTNVDHPPRQQPNNGTEVSMEFEATVGRN